MGPRAFVGVLIMMAGFGMAAFWGSGIGRAAGASDYAMPGYTVAVTFIAVGMASMAIGGIQKTLGKQVEELQRRLERLEEKGR